MGVANILNLGAACKPKPFVQVCTASDCICGEYHCDAEHMCVNCPISSDGTVRVSPCDSGNVTNVGEDNDAATVAAMKDVMATPTVTNATANVDWSTDSSNNTSFVTDAANEQVQATVDAAKEAIATAQATVDAAPAAMATDSADHADSADHVDDTDHADSADHVTDAADAAATATDTVNNSVKVEVSSASLLSASMMGIAAVTTAFVAIA